MSTIRDVARLAGVSNATVSRVINAPETVRDSTRERVRQAMAVCNYKYNALARGFVTKESNTVGLIIPNINNPVFAESARGVQDYSDRMKKQVILGNSYYQADKEASLIQTLLEKQVDGLVITTTNPKGEVIQSLIRDEVPFVLLYSTIRKGPMTAVGVDNYRGGYLATQHLVRLGHRRIGMVAGQFSISDRSLHRWHGYRKCLQDYAIAYDRQLVIQTEYSLGGGRRSVKEMLEIEQRPTAVFCSNDYLAMGAMKGAREAGLDLPAELSIVGFDDIQIASYVIPELTTIRQPAYEMGKLGTELLFKRMAGSTAKPVQMMLDSSLVIRDSTRPHGDR